jgi:hypothetical protein
MAHALVSVASRLEDGRRENCCAHGDSLYGIAGRAAVKAWNHPVLEGDFDDSRALVDHLWTIFRKRTFLKMIYGSGDAQGLSGLASTPGRCAGGKTPTR